MPLFPCPECGVQISTRAKACPQCGLNLEHGEALQRPEPSHLAPFTATTQPPDDVRESQKFPFAQLIAFVCIVAYLVYFFRSVHSTDLAERGAAQKEKLNAKQEARHDPSGVAPIATPSPDDNEIGANGKVLTRGKESKSKRK